MRYYLPGRICGEHNSFTVAALVFRRVLRTCKQNRLLFLLLCCVFTILCWFKFKRLAPSTHPARHFVLISAIYYAKHKIYPDNRFVLLLNGPSGAGGTTLRAISRNGTHEKGITFQLGNALPPIVECKWTAYIAHFETVWEPSTLEIAGGESAFTVGVSTKVNFGKPFAARRAHVGNCFSPLFYMERWQLLVTSIEIHRHFDSRIQVLYVQSALDQIMDLLQIYSDAVVVEPWYSIGLSADDIRAIGPDPNTELDWRNQATAHTDCLLKYGSAVDFLIVGDLDDVLLPAQGHTTYFSEILSHQNFGAIASLQYPRLGVDILASTHPGHFSLLDTLKSARVELYQPDDPKYVANTSLCETLWLHHSWVMKANSRVKLLQIKQGRMVHLRNWTFLDEAAVETDGRPKNNNSQESTADFWPVVPLLGSLLGAEAARQISANFERRVRENEMLFEQLPKRGVYASEFVRCYDRIFYGKDKVVDACPGPHRCRIRRKRGLKCTAGQRRFHASQLLDDLLLYTARKQPELRRLSNGCTF